MQLKRYRSLGDLLSDAQAKLVAAGYANPTCRVERVYFPGVDPQTGLNYYEQEICSVPGYIGGFDANVVAASGSIPGVGVNLAAERAYLNRMGDGPGTGQSYIEAFGSAPNVQVMNQLNPDGSRVTGNSSAPSAQQYQTQLDAQAQARATAPTPAQSSAPATGGAFKAASNTNPLGSSAEDERIALNLDFGFGDMFKDINPLFLVGGAAVLALFLFKK